MRYHKVRPNSGAWLKWMYIFYFILLFVFVSLFWISKKVMFLPGIFVVVFIGVLFIVKIRPNIIKFQRITRHIQRHILENSLYEMVTRNQKDTFSFYPNVSWRADESVNTLYIRFRLTGNKIDLRNLEQGFSDRLETICLNIYEERGFIEYLFELKAEERLKITSKDDIKNNKGNTTIALSPSLLWDYQKVPHFLISGTTGTGKTTFAKLVMTNLLKKGVRIVYVDIKHELEVEQFCHANAITYFYEIESISKAIAEVSEELFARTKDVERTGVGNDFDFSFPPIYLICDEFILMKLTISKKLYEEMFSQITSIILSGRSKSIFLGLLMQTSLAEYLGNSGIRNNIGLKVGLGQMTSTEIGMLFGNSFSSMRNLRYEIGTGLIMRTGVDSRPREIIVPYVAKGVFD